MRILIDSHVLIWLLYEPGKLSSQAKDYIQSASTVKMSTISLWELTLKFMKRKLAYSPDELAKGVEALNLERLTLQDEHLRELTSIKLPHGDPFDALLIAQSEAEACYFMTADRLLLKSKYHTVSAEK